MAKQSLGEFQERLVSGSGASWLTGNWQLELGVSSQWSCQRSTCSLLYLMATACASPHWLSMPSRHLTSPSAGRAPK
jgi:hypothetical protein